MQWSDIEEHKLSTQVPTLCRSVCTSNMLARLMYEPDRNAKSRKQMCSTESSSFTASIKGILPVSKIAYIKIVTKLNPPLCTGP